ncbi:hypothetical protein LSAT2_026380 [Lamellibrachia satsuma]|nr:hypothetical protein LSAT2_026380 [Lamellibrachia satsuma]
MTIHLCIGVDRLASSSSSVDSSVFCPGTPDCGDTPFTRVLADINGLDPNSSPSCLKLRRPRVQHTPVNKENIAESQVPSRWSPVQRPRALSREDEVIQCTKRNATKC